LQAVIDAQNDAIDLSHEHHFFANLMTTEFWKTLADGEFANFHNEFNADLAGRETIADIFALFVDEKYAGKLNSLDLGKTKRPNDEAEIIRLREQYRQLREALKQAGVTEDELSRDEAAIVYRFHAPSNNDPEYIIGARERTLIEAKQAVADGVLEYDLKKRMTFAMTANDFRRMRNATDSKSQNDPQIGLVLEPLLDGVDVPMSPRPTVYPIRTVYYAANRGFTPAPTLKN
jgi:hypothetical protein